MAKDEKKEVTTITQDHLTAEIERKENCIVEFRITCQEPLIKEAEKLATKRIAKEASVPGFRKGKAPTAILKKKFPQAVRDETAKDLADIAFKKAQEEAKIPLLSQNSKITYNTKKFSESEAELTFSFETEPVVPDFDVKEFEVKTESPAPVSEDAVNETIEKIQLFYASWEEISDRPAAIGDFVIVDIEDLDSDPPTKPFNNSRFEISERSMAEWMRDIIVGMKTGESKEGVSRPDEKESDEVKAKFTPKKVRITLNKLETPKKPEIDDELAKKMGVSTKDEMLTRLRTLIEKQEKNKVQNTNRDQLAEKLLEKVQFDIPKSTLEKEMRYRMNQYFQNPVSHNEWKTLSKEDQEKKEEEFRVASDNAIRMFYICQKVFRDNQLMISEEERHPKIESTLDAMFMDPADMPNPNQSKEQEALYFSRLMLSKAQDFMIDQVSG